MNRVAGKVVIITGGAAGLGRAEAQLLYDEGAQVVITDINVAGGEAAIAEMPGSLFLRHDVRREDDWQAVIATTLDRFGRLDALVNNAGIVRFGSVEECTLEDYELMSSVMSTGTFLGCKHALPAMSIGGGGSIINTASVTALRGNAAVPAYSAAKGAILALSRSVLVHAQDNNQKIRVNVILPGSHDTAMTRAAYALLPVSQTANVRSAEGKAEDVANLVVFLASNESKNINGAEIVIDNGRIVR